MFGSTTGFGGNKSALQGGTNSTNLFGSTNTGFGSTNPSTNPPTNTLGTSNMFGNASGTFGQPTTSGMFGSSTTTAAPTQNTNLFGNTQNTNLFGNTQTTQQSNSMFAPATSIQTQPATTGFQSSFFNQPKTQTTGLGTNTSFSGNTGLGMFSTQNNPTQGQLTFQQQTANLAEQTQQNAQSIADANEMELMAQKIMMAKESWDPNSVNCQFKHYFYNSVDPTTVDRYQCPGNEDPVLWKQAQLDNPDPKSMVPALVVGFEGLRTRIACQSEMLESYSNFLENLKTKLSEQITNHQNQTVVKANDIKRRQTEIDQRLLRLMKNLQMLRLHGQLLKPEEEIFRVRTEQLENAIHSNGAAKYRLIELQNQIQKVQLEMQKAGGLFKSNMQQAGQQDSSSETPMYEDESGQYKKVSEVLEMHNSGLIYLSDTVDIQIPKIKTSVALAVIPSYAIIRVVEIVFNDKDTKYYKNSKDAESSEVKRTGSQRALD
ncbi:hypothetical protein BB558_000200 [Smittium angustum]|uniref:Nucleoporin Nup54 alpha-helical domain-containing protein n=1 Tax=Smittium angustum TaxID=133377 RepID=A0A2U1JEV4_SMIAN|nr:hypothetical protein BB558_000200 [Smittium angustum]